MDYSNFLLYFEICRLSTFKQTVLFSNIDSFLKEGRLLFLVEVFI